MLKGTRPLLLLCALPCGYAAAYDNGPQVLDCDTRFGPTEQSGRCMIVGSGMAQGISWVVFEARGMRFRYDSSAPDTLERLGPDDNAVQTLRVTNTYGPCRPGGADADVYALANGDRICLYW